MIGRLLSSCLVLAATAGLLIGGRSELAAPLSAQGTPSVVALRNATIITATRGTIANGTVLIRDGKIAAVGTNVQIPSGADVYDATGKFISPGIIDAHSHIGNDAINEGSVSVSSMTGMEDVLDPTDINIYRDLAGGTTTANILHGSANAIGGKTVVIKLRWGKTRASDLLIPGALPGIKFALGENVTRKRGQALTNPVRFPTTRQGVEYVIRDAFTRAKAYRKEWQDYEAKKKAGAEALAPRRDLQLDALVEVLEGKRLVHAHSYRADEILMLIRTRRRDGLQDHHVPARPRGLQGRQGDRRAQCRRVHLLRLVGLQDGGGRRHPAQRLAHDAQGRARLDQLGRCGAGAAAEHGSGEGRPLRRRDRRSGVRDGDDQSREAAQDRQPRRLDRSRQGRRPGRLEQASAVHRRDRRADLRRRHRLLRPREGSAARRRHPEGERRARDDRFRRRRRPTASTAGRPPHGRRRRSRSSTSRAMPAARPGRSPTRASSPSRVR